MDPPIINEVFLRRLSSHIGDEWKSLAIQLGFRPDQIERLGRDYTNTEDKIFSMLVDWKQSQTRDTDYQDGLVNALTRCGRSDLAVNLHQMIHTDELSLPRGVNDQSLEMLSSHIGMEWQMIATQLGLRRDEIDRLKQDFPKTEDRVFNMLVSRRKHYLEDDLEARLADVLGKSGRLDLAETLSQCHLRNREDIPPHSVPILSSPSSSSTMQFRKICQKELITFYEQQMGTVQLLPWGHDVVDLDDIFVDLTLGVDDKLLLGNAGKPLQGSEDLIDLKGKNKQRLNRVLVTGFAGSGKSTTVAKLAYDWARELRGVIHKRSIFSSYKLLFILSLREMDISKSLVDAIVEQILPLDTAVRRQDLSTYLETHGDAVLVLFDGLDENSFEALPKKLIHDVQCILANRKMRDTCVVVTSRPYKVESLGEYQKQYVQVKLTGFSEENIDVYIKKFFKDDHQAAESLAEEIRKSPSVKSLAQIPVMLLMLCLLWSDDQRLPERYTELYEQVVDYLWRRYKKAYGTSELVDLQEVLLTIGKVALGGCLYEGKCVFLDTEFTEDVLSVACQVGVLTKERLRSRLNMKTAVSFLHKSIQEYSGACYWVSLLRTNEEEFRAYLDHIKEDTAILAQVDLLSFACGLSEKAASLIIPHVIQILQHRTTESLRIGGITNNTKKDMYSFFRILRESHLDYQSLHMWLQPLFKSHILEIRQNPKLAIKDFHHLVKHAAHSKAESFLSTVSEIKVSFSSEAANELAEMLREMTEVGILVLSWEPEAPGFPSLSSQLALSDAIGRLSRLKDITVLAKGWQKLDISKLINRETSSGLRKLELGNVDVNAQVISNCLARQKTLRSLSLTNTTLTSESASALLSHLHPSVQKVHLVSTQIGCAVQQLKPLMSSLHELVMRETKLEEAHVDVLADFLQYGKKLKHLDLSWNNVGGSMAKLAYQLRHCPSLDTLSLINANISQDGVIALTKGIQFLPLLTSLMFSLGSHLKCTNIPHNNGFIITEAILRAIPHVPKLESLYVKNLGIPDDSAPSDMVYVCLSTIGFHWPGILQSQGKQFIIQNNFGLLLGAKKLTKLRAAVIAYTEKESGSVKSSGHSK
ncbi:LOW QUALITY PROTEIN: NLR family CARD domain-containing protein 4-like [Amphiura filiformis]|uniref:LOW QUALITY PROTEIN: NLR family CARD domain-containing protein 4-like n=1 Tax=Amphiura filiformis TaxID=82378 RepID=UPI003B21C091